MYFLKKMRLIKVNYFKIAGILFVLVLLYNILKWNTNSIVQKSIYSVNNIYLINTDSEYKINNNEQICHVTNSKTDATQNIPAFMYDVMDVLVQETDKFQLQDCKKKSNRKTNFVYIKNHKCASDTLSAVFRRFALNKNLSIVLPIGAHSLLGWPHQLRRYMYRLKKTKEFNIMLDHQVYNYTYFAEIMPEDTVYFSSLREPYGRLVSAVTYFAIGKCGLMPSEIYKDRILATEEFLNHMDYYNNIYLSIENLYSKEICGCIPNGVSMVKNSMAFDLGFPVGYHIGTVDQSQNYAFIINWLKEIYEQMPFVILFEYFDYSMVMLKRYMCWSMKDILYKHLNFWKNPEAKFPQSKVEEYRNWTNVDTLLYHLYNRSFWNQADKLGQDFYDETKEYQSQLQEVAEFCFKSKKNYHNPKTASLNIRKTGWNEAYAVLKDDCVYMNDQKHLRLKVKEVYEELSGGNETEIKELYGQYIQSGYVWC